MTRHRRSSPFQEQLVESQVARQLGMECRRGDYALTAQHRPVVDRGEDVDRSARGLDDRRADEHRGEGAAGEIADVEVGFEGVDLAAEGVAAHDEIDGAEAALVRAAVKESLY